MSKTETPTGDRPSIVIDEERIEGPTAPSPPGVHITHFETRSGQMVIPIEVEGRGGIVGRTFSLDEAEQLETAIREARRRAEQLGKRGDD